ELLVLVPYGEAQATVAALEAALSGTHHLVADVSDARAVFTIRGARADEVLRKLCPVDLDALAEGEIRRTRAAQVASAFWKSGPDEFTLVSFRSVAAYVMELLEVSVRSGSELFPAWAAGGCRTPAGSGQGSESPVGRRCPGRQRTGGNAGGRYDRPGRPSALDLRNPSALIRVRLSPCAKGLTHGLYPSRPSLCPRCPRRARHVEGNARIPS